MSENPFPGPQPYRAADRGRFHGREEMARRLSASVLAHRCVTVFGPSGAGKSSLMQAAVIPRLVDELGFRAVRVDSWPEGAPAASWLAEALFDGFKLGARPKEGPGSSALDAAQRAARRSERPFLIYLDQIEQLLYDSRDPADMDGFAECINALAESPLRGLKLVLSLREDYLGRLRDRLEGRLRLLDHGFRVSPLRVGELSETMVKVAATGDPPQTWSLEETRQMLMQVRTPGQAPRDEAEAQAAYAQIVCRAIWAQRDAADGSAAQAKVLDVEVILDQYVETTLAGLGSLHDDALMLLENHLITPDGSRTLRTEKELLGAMPPEALAMTLRTLENAAILRAEEHQGRRYFELGHDWLAKKIHARVEQRLREAVERERERAREAAEQEREREREAAAREKEEAFNKVKRRLRVIAITASILALVLIAVVAVPITRSYLNNRALAHDTNRLLAAAEMDFATSAIPLQERLKILDDLAAKIDIFEDFDRNGVPDKLRWGMYVGDALKRRVIAKYVAVLQTAFVLPVRTRLEAQLKQIKGENYLAERGLLRAYLRLGEVIAESDPQRAESDPQRAESDPQRAELPPDGPAIRDLAGIWADILRASSDEMTEAALIDKLRPHVRLYTRFVERRRVTPVKLDDALVASARTTLRAVPANVRHFDLFVNSVSAETRATSSATDGESLKYPPISLFTLFADRPEVLKVITSSLQRSEARPFTIAGPYTELGHYKVLKNFAVASQLLEGERQLLWGSQAAGSAPESPDFHRLADDYECRYIEQWSGFLADIDVPRPTSANEAAQLYEQLIRPEAPYLRLLRALEDHTQWRRSAGSLEREDAGKSPLAGDILMIDRRLSSVPPTFQAVVRFGIGGPVDETPLAKYLALLRALRDDLLRIGDESPTGVIDPARAKARLDAAMSATDALLKPLDKATRKTLEPLLRSPLTLRRAAP